MGPNFISRDANDKPVVDLMLTMLLQLYMALSDQGHSELQCYFFKKHTSIENVIEFSKVPSTTLESTFCRRFL